MAPETLDSYKQYGESILQKLDLVPPNPSKLEDWVPASLDDCLIKLGKAAQKTVEFATSPVKIGVMGEFSSGKTLLLGSLIGYADALPVSENPTTGNVTAIHLIPQDGFQTTQIDNFTVEYLEHEGVQECLRFMLQEANRRTTAVGLDSVPFQELTTWDNILNWCESTWNSSNNLELRYLLRELVIFVRAYVAYGRAMCSHSFQIDANTAHQGLKLAEIPIAIQNLGFQDLPKAPIPLGKTPQNLQVQLLQKSFPLIRRVDIDVKISQQIWNLSTGGGIADFVLLDFPGLGAANSGVRDTFLSLRELSEVQTILILLNGKSPGGDRANQIFTMMQQQRPQQDLKDLILVGVGRFNQLPLESEGGERELDNLIDDAASNTPLTQETVLQKLRVLNTTIDNASAFTTKPDRIVVLDQLMGLADLAKRDSTVKAGSDEFLANLEYPGYLQQSQRMRQKWGSLSERLLETDPRSTLGQQLKYFAQDGGIGKLRELIQKHVATHGLQQLELDTRRAADNLAQQQNHLKQILAIIEEEGIPTAESQTLIDLRTTIDSLYKTYRSFQKELGQEPLQDRRGIAVSDVVKDELTYKILNWNQWTLLFNKTVNGNIALTKSKGAAGKLLAKSNWVNIPTKSEDFYPPFAETIKELSDFARDRIHQAVIDLLTTLSTEVASQRDYLKAILKPEMEQKIRTELGNEEADLFFQLLHGYDPKQWAQPIISEITNQEKEIESEPIFPLARANEKHDMGQIFDWSPDRMQNNPQNVNHLLLVLRLRDEINTIASVHLVQYISEINQQINDEISGFLEIMIFCLQNISRKEILLKYIADDNEEINTSIPSWLQTMAEIASTK